jgi:hypothetical protein
MNESTHHLAVLLAASALLLFPATANGKNCFMVNDDNAPAVTASGRITAHYRVPKGSEVRAADGPFLKLDTPFLLTAAPDAADQCFEWREIVIMSDEVDAQPAKWINQHVIIFGQLNRFVSALVAPAIFIEVKTIKKGSLP